MRHALLAPQPIPTRSLSPRLLTSGGASIVSPFHLSPAPPHPSFLLSTPLPPPTRLQLRLSPPIASSGSPKQGSLPTLQYGRRPPPRCLDRADWATLSEQVHIKVAVVDMELGGDRLGARQRWIWSSVATISLSVALHWLLLPLSLVGRWGSSWELTPVAYVEWNLLDETKCYLGAFWMSLWKVVRR